MSPMFRTSADLFAELNRMQALLDQVFPTPGSSIRSQGGAGFPVVNVGTTPASVEVQALVPGLDADKLEITIDRGLLVIAGERRSELPAAGERQAVYANERFAGKFRRVVGLPNPGHSVAKLMRPTTGPCVIVASYTHPEYARTMGETFELMGMTALLSRGLEGEVVSDPRRTAQIDGFVRGVRSELQAQESGTASEVPGLPKEIDIATTAEYTRRVLNGELPVPEAIATQVRHITQLASHA